MSGQGPISGSYCPPDWFSLSTSGKSEYAGVGLVADCPFWVQLLFILPPFTTELSSRLLFVGSRLERCPKMWTTRDGVRSNCSLCERIYACPTGNDA